MSKTIGFEQVPTLRWPSGRERAAGWIRLTATALSERTGLVFQSGVDDLDAFEEAAIKFRSGRLMLLLGRPRPGYGIDIYIDTKDSIAEAIKELSKCLQLQNSEIEVFADA